MALRLALAGEDVIIGSRAAAAAEEVAGLASGAVVEGALNEETAARADVVFIAVPYSAQRPTIEPLAGHVKGVEAQRFCPLKCQGKMSSR